MTSQHLFKECDAMANNRIILMMNTDEITELPEPDDRVLMYITGYIFPLVKKPEEDPDQ